MWPKPPRFSADTGKPHIATHFRPDVEGLRGIAILLVVLFHCGVPGFAGGFTGVDIFFALSGYLITNLIVNEIERTGTFSFREFYARRVRRLLPASGLVTVCTLLLGFAVYSPLEQAAHASMARYTFAYISNLLFMRDAADYFARDVATNPYLQTWSLAVEEQFYVFWPAVIALTLFRAGTRRRAVIALAVLCVTSFGLCLWWTHIQQPWAFFGSPARAWEFGLGGLASMVRKPALLAHLKSIKSLAWIGFVAVLAAGCCYSAQMSFPGYAAVVPVVGTIAVLLPGATSVKPSLQLFLGNPVLLQLGRLSYSWYLWHWPILMLAAVRFPSITWRGKLLAAGAALALAELTFLFLENPIRFNKFLFARPGLSLSLVVLIPLMGVTVAHFAERQSLLELGSAQQSRLRFATQDVSPLRGAHCIAQPGEAKLLECDFGNLTSSTTVVLFGDSHAEHWFPALEPVAAKNGWHLITMVKSSCPAARVDVYNFALKRIEGECSSWREAALSRIAQLHPSAVLIGESVAYMVGLKKEVASHPLLTSTQWEGGIRSTFQYLNSRGLNTVVLADVPHAAFNVPTCLSRAAAHGWAMEGCLLQRNVSLYNDVRHAEASAADNFSSVRIVDFSDKLCSGTVCPPVIGGQIVYRDTDHLTATFARTFAPELALRLVPLVGR
jgi:peptidoglycan/LPS O-acetylase OafA/YrhL